MRQAIKNVRDHNAWRQGGEFPLASCAKLTVSIDDVITAAERYEWMRKQHINVICELWRRSLAGERFDDVVGKMMKGKR